jgi:hypothetical protein
MTGITATKGHLAAAAELRSELSKSVIEAWGR